MDFTPPFAQWLKQRRKALDLTQEDLAQRTHCARVTIRKIESGQSRLSRQMAEQLADALDVPATRRAAFVAFARGVEPPGGRNNLPTPATPLVGRAQDVQAAVDLLLRDDVRLLTLFGPPGVGKTRLAIEVARSLDEGFADGICFVPLAPLADPSHVTSAIAECLGVRISSKQSALDSLTRYLRDKQLLLLVDNFEHLLPAGPRVAELMLSAPRLKVLVTSRAVLRLSAEYEYEVLPLPCPPPSSAGSAPEDEGGAGELARYSAVELFVQRARAVKSAFALSPSNGAAVAEVCRRVDGLPLAIELAAVRTRMFTPQTLLMHLDHHIGAVLRLLTTGPRDLPARQQSLRATIDWSYQLLSAGEKTLLQRLAVFAGGCTLEAVRAICGEKELADESLIADLQSLIDNSLVRQGEEADGESRYYLLETIREYALERLEASGEADVIRRRHVCYFSHKSELDVDSPDWSTAGTQVFKWLAKERHNLDAALTWSKGYADEPRLHLHITIALAWLARVGIWYLGIHGDARELEAELVWSLQRNPDLPPVLRALSLVGLGMLYANLGDVDRETRAFDEGLAISHAAGAVCTEVGISHMCGWSAYTYGDLALSEQHFARMLALGEQVGSPGWVLNGIHMLGHLALEHRDYDRAGELLDRALTLARARAVKTDILGGEAIVLQDLGLLAYELGDYTMAYEWGQQALSIFEEEGEVQRRSGQHLYVGQAALALQHTDVAVRHFRDCLRLASEYGARRLPRLALAQLALAALDRGDPSCYARLMGALAGCNPLDRRPWDSVTMLEVDRYMTILSEAQMHLDEPAYAAAWAEGRQMTLDQAVAYALQAVTAEADESPVQ